MAANSVNVLVNDRQKTLRFTELITTGSTYAMSFKGATIAAGEIFLSCRIDGTETLVAYGTITSNAATLSTNTSQLAEAMANLPIGAVRSFFAVIHKDGTTDYENVATGMVNIANAGGTWTDTTTGAAILYKGPKGDQGDKGDDGDPGADGVSPTVTITTITGGHRVTITDKDHPSGQSFDVMDGSSEGMAAKPTTGGLAADSSLDDVIAKINTLVTQLKS